MNQSNSGSVLDSLLLSLLVVRWDGDGDWGWIGKSKLMVVIVEVATNPVEPKTNGVVLLSHPGKVLADVAAGIPLLIKSGWLLGENGAKDR